MNRSSRCCALLALTLVSACQQKPQTDLTAKVLFTAHGSYDAVADHRSREGKGQRQVVWQKHPPFPAAAVVVDYDSDLRPLSWRMTIKGPQFQTSELAGKEAVKVKTSRGPGLLIRSGRLKDVLLLPKPDNLQLLTLGYVTQQAPELLPAFKQK